MKLQRKICDSEIKEFDEKDLSVVHFISSELPDRGGDILYAGKNDKGAGMIMLGRVVVLQQHGWGEMGSEPIAKPLWIKPSTFKDAQGNSRNGIECKTQFFPDELGKRLWKKTTESYMPNWSVGWRPIESKVEVKTDKNGDEIRHVYEWELLEYSIVGVPMQPDAQTREVEALLFKMIPEGEDRFGELVGWKAIDGPWEEKPYPNEHACRLEDPDKYIRIRRQNDKFGKGIHAIWGVQSGGKPVELQAIRFSKSKFTAAEARAWIKDHKYKCKMFEPASEKCGKCGKPMALKWSVDVTGGECQKTCEVDFEYVHDGECKKEEDVCSCDGEADDKGVCKRCQKPKPEKKVLSSVDDIIICPKCSTPYLKVLDKEIDGQKVYLWKKQCECQEIKQDDTTDITADELPADPESDEDVGFVMVDADTIRKDHATEDFIHGGHYYTFDFIPEPEIWIDQRMTDEDIMSLKMALFVEREMMKYCAATLMQCKEVGSVSGKWISHMMDSMMEGGGNHDEKDMHYFMHDGNHFHNRGQTIRWDSQTERYNVHSLLIGEIAAVLTSVQKEAFEKDMDEAIKQIAAKYGLRETPPAEPEAEKEKQAANHPESRRIIVITDGDKKQAEEDRKKQLTKMLRPVVIQIEETMKKIPEIVRGEINRLKGRVE